MFIQNLELHNFRRFEKLNIKFTKRISVLVEKNGSGKSTVLEALAIAV